MNWWKYLKPQNTLGGYESLKFWIQINSYNYVTISEVNVDEFALLLVMLRMARNTGKGWIWGHVYPTALFRTSVVVKMEIGVKTSWKEVVSGQNTCALKIYIREKSCTGKLHLPQMLFIIHREWIKPHGFPRSISVLSIVAGQE